MFRISFSSLIVSFALLANLTPAQAAMPSVCLGVKNILVGDQSPEAQEAFRQAIQSGANPNERCRFPEIEGSFFLALPLLISTDQVDLAQLLIEKGADVNIRDGDGIAPLHYLGTSESLLKLLLSKGADINASDGTGILPIHNVFNRHDLAITQKLVAAGANVNARSRELMTPLHFLGNPAIVTFLLSRGAQVNAKTNQNFTPLHYALSKLEIARLLIKAGADLTIQNRFGAPIHGPDLSPEVLKLILTKGVNVNLRNADRQTPLRIHRFRADLTQILLGKGAQVNLQDNLGRSPLHDVNIDVAKLLVKAKANINLADNQGQTPLHRAALEEESGFGIELVSLFISQNVKSDIKDKQGKTAFAIACEYNKTAIIKLLADYQGRRNQPSKCSQVVPKKS
jgi:uncharacterized protein